MYFFKYYFYNTNNTMFSWGHYLPNRLSRSLASSLASTTFKTPDFKYNMTTAGLARAMNQSFEG